MSATENGLPAILNEHNSEQREVSRFLHDTLAQDLVALAFTLSRLESLSLADAAREEVDSAMALIHGCCSQVRMVDAMMASSMLDGSPPDAAIEQLTELVRAETGIPVTLCLDQAPALSHDARTLLLSVLRACFALVVRRRAKSAILIRLQNSGQAAVLNIEISPPPPGTCDGWTLFTGCAAALGGEFAVQKNPERFTAFLCLPEGAGA